MIARNLLRALMILVVLGFLVFAWNYLGKPKSLNPNDAIPIESYLSQSDIDKLFPPDHPSRKKQSELTWYESLKYLFDFLFDHEKLN